MIGTLLYYSDIAVKVVTSLSAACTESDAKWSCQCMLKFESSVFFGASLNLIMVEELVSQSKEQRVMYKRKQGADNAILYTSPYAKHHDIPERCSNSH